MLVCSKLQYIVSLPFSWDGGHIHNLNQLDDNNNSRQHKKDLSIRTELPDADILLFQEVWDRFFAAALIYRLRPRFRHFVVDVSKQALGWNFCTGSKSLYQSCTYIMNVPAMDD